VGGYAPLVLFTAVAVLAFLVMEPVTYLTHRFVMHGLAERIHRSHHVPSPGRWEANDLFPVVFSGAAMMATVAAYQGWTSRLVLAAVAGVSVYGLLYALVHDVYIHRRLAASAPPASGSAVRRRSGRGHPLLERLADAHRIHHLYNGEPYGMLLPVVPRELRERAARTDRDPVTRTA
jgi:beta-carotene 3-hydroxylase